MSGSSSSSASRMADAGSIFIPVRGKHDVVEVQCGTLPQVDDVLRVLMAEIAPLNVWLRFSVEYYRQDRIPEFEKLIMAGTDDGLWCVSFSFVVVVVCVW
jgi:hypothetical protein